LPIKEEIELLISTRGTSRSSIDDDSDCDDDDDDDDDDDADDDDEDDDDLDATEMHIPNFEAAATDVAVAILASVTPFSAVCIVFFRFAFASVAALTSFKISVFTSSLALPTTQACV
jgi:hypothetical protein